jgi:hypothetical protein
MTLSEFATHRDKRPCESCGAIGVVTQLNPNNNGLLVRCPICGSNRPWGALLYLQQSDGKRPKRPPLPNGATLDSIWKQYDDRCVICGAPKAALATLGIGRQVHHVIPYAAEGHKGPLVPICTHCHEVANARQRVYWFLQRVVLKNSEARHHNSQEAESGEPSLTWYDDRPDDDGGERPVRPARPDPGEPDSGPVQPRSRA